MAHAGGRPLKFKNAEEVEKLAEDYFTRTPINQWTITGLALALDTSRETLMNYEKKEQFFDTIKRAKTRVENSYELTLRTRGSAGDIFGLKNFGWRDRSEVDTRVEQVQPILGGLAKDALPIDDSDQEDSQA